MTTYPPTPYSCCCRHWHGIVNRIDSISISSFHRVPSFCAHSSRLIAFFMSQFLGSCFCTAYQAAHTYSTCDSESQDFKLQAEWHYPSQIVCEEPIVIHVIVGSFGLHYPFSRACWSTQVFESALRSHILCSSIYCPESMWGNAHIIAAFFVFLDDNQASSTYSMNNRASPLKSTLSCLALAPVSYDLPRRSTEFTAQP